MHANSTPTKKRLRNWWQTFEEARTRILICYLVLMSFSSAVSVLLVRQMQMVRLEDLVQQSLQQEIEEFRQLKYTINPDTGEPFGQDIEAMFDAFVASNIPEQNEFLLAISDGQLYRASPAMLPDALRPETPLMQDWTEITEPQKGFRIIVPNQTSDQEMPIHLHYRAEPIVIAGRVRGVFVVARITTDKQAEVNESVWIVAKVSLAVLVMASLLAWAIAGRMLAPLRLLREAVCAIDESNLTERIPVKGEGDIAELALTFNAMMDRLEVIFKTQRQLLDDVGHELRTPITIIRGHLEAMDPALREQQATLDIVLDELDRIGRFIHELLLLAKAERPDFLLPEMIDLASFTKELYTKITTLADRHWKIDAIATGCIVADRQRLTEAIVNLAQNAVQHTGSGDTIALGSALQRGQVYLWVWDSGEGIEPADQQRIFQRYVRGNSNRNPEGTGLGLAIVQAIAHAHGGRVDLLSHPHEGSKFILALPLKGCVRSSIRK